MSDYKDWDDRYKLISLIEGLLVENPWTSSFEGLDDHCLFCESDKIERNKDITVRVRLHEPDCAWIRAMDALGRQHPYHKIHTERRKS